MKTSIGKIVIGFAFWALILVPPLFAQTGWLPFHWAWRDYPFSDSFVNLQDLEMITVTPQGKRKPAEIQYHYVQFDSLARSLR